MHQSTRPGLGVALIVWLATATAAPVAAQDAPSPYPRDDVAVGYRVDPDWPQKPSTTIWAGMSSMAVDDDGLVWTFNRGEMPVQTYRSDGELVRAWGEGVFTNPHQLQIDDEGNVWTADDGDHTVRKFTADGRLLLTLGVPGRQAATVRTSTDQPMSPSRRPERSLCPTGTATTASSTSTARGSSSRPSGRWAPVRVS